MAALADVRKKWHIPPAFSVEFIGYYLDRITRLNEIKTNLQEQLQSNRSLVDEQQKLRDEYDQVSSVRNNEHKKIKFIAQPKSRSSIAIGIFTKFGSLRAWLLIDDFFHNILIR